MVKRIILIMALFLNSSLALADPGLTDSQKTDYSFKKLKSLGRTTQNKAYYEESEPGGILLDNSALITDSIPSTPPSTTTSTVKCYIPTPGDGRLLLTVDSSVAGSKCWKAKVTGVTQKNWIPPYYGSGYAARIFKSDNSTEIPTTDSSDWIFDYESGVLTFEGTCPDTGGIYLHAYKYVGNLGALVKAQIDSEAEFDALLFDVEGEISAGTTAQFFRGDKTWSSTLVGNFTANNIIVPAAGKIYLDGGTDTYITFNSTNNTIEFYIDNTYCGEISKP